MLEGRQETMVVQSVLERGSIMANGKENPNIGYGKVGAAAIAGAIVTIASYVFDKMGWGAFPTEVVSAGQTLITAAAVYFTPQTLMKS